MSEFNLSSLDISKTLDENPIVLKVRALIKELEDKLLEISQRLTQIEVKISEDYIESIIDRRLIELELIEDEDIKDDQNEEEEYSDEEIDPIKKFFGH